MLAQDSFKGFYHAYLLLQDPKDAEAASRLVRTDEHRRMMENVTVASLVDKSRLLDLDPTTRYNSNKDYGGKLLDGMQL